MIRYRHFILFGALTATLITGCNDRATPSNSASNVNLASTIDGPCATVLLPLPESKTARDGETDRSIARYQQAVATAARPLLALERLGWGFVAKARASRDAGYYRLAERVAACMDATDSGTPEAMLLRGHALHNLHRFPEAEALARRLVEQRGLWFDFALLGDVLIERGALDDAVDAYQKVIDQRPGPQAQVRVAQLRWLKGDLEGALDMIANAVRTTSPRTPEAAAWAHVRFASMLVQINEWPAAERALDRALALQNEYPPALHLDDAANTTDVYAFVTEKGANQYLTTALAVYPFEEPGIGPNKYNFDDEVLYEIHVATGNDLKKGRPTLSYQFKFDTDFKTATPSCSRTWMSSKTSTTPDRT